MLASWLPARAARSCSCSLGSVRRLPRCWPRPRCGCWARVGRGPPATRPSTPTGAPCGPQNARGYRDRERATREAAPACAACVSLGDSFAWGASVEFEDAYPQRLERGLDAAPRRALGGREPGPAGHEHGGPGRAARATRAWPTRPTSCCSGYVLNDSEDAQAAETRRAEDWAAGAPGAAAACSTARRSSASCAGALCATAENRRRIAGYRSMYAADAPGWIASREALEAHGRRSAASAACRSWSRSSRCSATRSTTRIRSPRCTHGRAGRGGRGRAGGRPAAGLPRAALGPAGRGRRRRRAPERDRAPHRRRRDPAEGARRRACRAAAAPSDRARASERGTATRAHR